MPGASAVHSTAIASPRYDAPGQHIYAPALLKRLSELAPADA